MKHLLLIGTLAIAFSLGAVGCSKTAEGVQEDSANAGKEVAKAGKEVGKAADAAADASKDASKNTSAALVLTPKVKAALINDPQLNDTRNMIDVDSADNVVHLKGHVLSKKLKDRATEVAQKVLTDGNSTDKLNNELAVQP